MDNPIDNIRDTERQTDETELKNPKGKNPLILLFDILMTGTPGWRRLRKARLTPEQTAAGCLYPLASLAAICRFSDYIYAPEFILSDTLVSAVGIFISFFFSYFAVQVACRWLFPADLRSKTDLPYFRQLVQYALASLALFWIPAELLPVIQPVTVFLPIWTAFIITKGMHYLRIPDSRLTRCSVTVVLVTVCMPYLILWLCSRLF